MSKLLKSVLIIFFPLLSMGQEIDSTLLNSIAEKFKNGNSINIEFRFYSHHQFRDLINIRNLQTIIQYLKNNEKCKIELRCHSDCRGSHDYNLRLIQMKSERIKAWIVDRGINKERIKAKGKGRGFPLKLCKQCNCEDEIHSSNRRIEIVKIA